MPINLKYTWEETSESVIIRVNIRGVSRKILDIEVLDTYVKVNSPPHFLIVDFKKEIDDEGSPKHVFEGHELVFNLKKKEKEIWNTLQIDTTDYTTKKKRREESQKKRQDRLREKRKKLADEKRRIGKDLFLESWEKEKEYRRKIQEAKKKETKSINEELAQWKSSLNKEDSSSPSIFKGIFPEREEPKPSPDPHRTRPEIRKTRGPVKVRFTPRQLRHFAREDKDREILKKYEMWKSKNKPDDSLEDPKWLKNKGDRFYRRGDMDASVHAYSACISKRPDFLIAYANRSACYLKMKDYRKCIHDCNAFNQLFHDKLLKKEIWNEVEKKKYLRIHQKVLIRRGTSYFYTGLHELALKDYETCIKLEPDEKTKQELANDHMKIRDFIDSKNSSSSKKKEWKVVKQKGDDHFIYGNYKKAIELYSTVINILRSTTENLAILSNRSACYLKLGRYSRSIEDATRVIETIQMKRNSPQHQQQQQPNQKKKKKKKYTSKEMKLWNTVQLKCYLRRGAAYCGVGEFEKGYNDYERAFRMVPHDQGIEMDLKEISTRLQGQIHGEWVKNRANYFYRKGDYESAIQSYSIAIRKDPTNVVYYANRSQCHMLLKDYVKVIKDVNSAFSVVPDDVRKKQEKEILRKKKKREKENKMKSGSNNKNSPIVIDDIIINTKMTASVQLKLYMRRGTAFEELGELKSAKKDYESALMINPNSQATNKSMRRIEEKEKSKDNDEEEEEEEKN